MRAVFRASPLKQIPSSFPTSVRGQCSQFGQNFFSNRCYELLLMYNKRQRCVDLAAQGGGLVTPCRAFHRIRGGWEGQIWILDVFRSSFHTTWG